MIIIEPTRSLKQPFKVRYTGRNNETLATSELLKSKRSCWRNIYAVSIQFHSYAYGYAQTTKIEVKDLTVSKPKVFIYDISGIKKKAGFRK